MTTPAKVKRAKRRPYWTDPFFGIKVPRRGSQALLEFLASYRQISVFLAFVLNMVGTIERTASTAHEALVDTERDPAKKEALIASWKSRRGPLEELKTHRQFLLEIVLVRHVENYLNFLSSLLKEIFEAKPESLRSAEKIDLETVLRHANIDDLVRTIAERKVESLSYASFSDLAEYFDEKFHVILIAPEDKPLIIDAIETRNISVHNRCQINSRFVTRTGSDPSKIGHLRQIVIGHVEDVARCLANSAIRVDKEARRRLGVRGHHSNTVKTAR